MLGAASLAIPGTLPKIKNVRGLDVTLRDVNMPAHRGNVADITVGDIELASMSRNEDVLVQGRPMYEPDITSSASKLAESKDRLAYLKKNDPTSSEIPTLEKSINNRLGNYPEEVADMSAGLLEGLWPMRQKKCWIMFLLEQRLEPRHTLQTLTLLYCSAGLRVSCPQTDLMTSADLRVTY